MLAFRVKFFGTDNRSSLFLSPLAKQFFLFLAKQRNKHTTIFTTRISKHLWNLQRQRFESLTLGLRVESPTHCALLKTKANFAFPHASLCKKTIFLEHASFSGGTFCLMLAKWFQQLFLCKCCFKFIITS